MSVIRVGTTADYAVGWENAFGNASVSGRKASVTKRPVKKATAKKKRVVKKTKVAKKKATKKKTESAIFTRDE